MELQEFINSGELWAGWEDRKFKKVSFLLPKECQHKKIIDKISKTISIRCPDCKLYLLIIERELQEKVK